MSVFANPIGQTSYGVSSLTNSGVFSGVAPTASSQTLQATGVNTFAFTSEIPFSAGAGVIQVLNFPAPDTVNVTVLGGTTSSYNASALFMTFNFTPLQSTSQIYALWSMSGGFPFDGAGNALIWCGYLNGNTTPVISSYLADFNSGSGLLGGTKAASLIGSNLSGSQSFSVCTFAGTSASTPTATYDSSAVQIWEVSTVPPSPFAIDVSTATPVLCLSFPVPVNSSVVVEGDWVAFNNTSTPGAAQGGNGGAYLFVGIRGSGNVALANNNAVMTQVLAFGVAPYIYVVANSGTQALEVYGVGISGQTFNFNFNFTTN